jgi:hypothetical protein
MKYTMFWSGGGSYAAPTDKDGEQFRTLAECKDEFRYRFEDQDPYYPCVDESCWAWIIVGEEPTQENGPDYVLEIGPRGGVRLEKCS